MLEETRKYSELEVDGADRDTCSEAQALHANEKPGKSSRKPQNKITKYETAFQNNL